MLIEGRVFVQTYTPIQGTDFSDPTYSRKMFELWLKFSHPNVFDWIGIVYQQVHLKNRTIKGDGNDVTNNNNIRTGLKDVI